MYKGLPHVFTLSSITVGSLHTGLHRYVSTMSHIDLVTAGCPLATAITLLHVILSQGHTLQLAGYEYNLDLLTDRSEF